MALFQEGFARVRCRKCKHEMFVAYSCKQRWSCPSCHQKRTLLTALHVAEEVCFPLAHRQAVLTLPIEPVVLFLAAQPTGGRLTGVGAGLTLRRIVHNQE
jgi:hypothetical protein